MRIECNNQVDLNRVVVPHSISPTATNEIQHTASSEPPNKRPRIEGNDCLAIVEPSSTSSAKSSFPFGHTNDGTRPLSVTARKNEGGTSSVITNSPVVSNFSGGSSVESLNQTSSVAMAGELPGPPASSSYKPPPNSASTPATEMAPFKATTMEHLGAKYLGELQYMLVEFRKLERQLLGAKGAAQIEESAGSRERREKLHSFILHLEDTIRQIEEGCRLEADGKSPLGVTDPESSQIAHSSALANMTKEKEVEESVQKLEEHILANLLPVKVRLKKQLAAQQGATRNPVGMPAPRRGSLTATVAPGGKGTFAAAAEHRRKQAEAARFAAQHQQEQKSRHVSDPTQFGTPLKGGSSLTRNLHGTTLGSKQRTYGHGVGAPAETEHENPNKRILYGGMVPESTQHKSGVAAATGVHDMVIENPSLIPEVPPQYDHISENNTKNAVSASLPVNQDVALSKPLPVVKPVATLKVAPLSKAQPGTFVSSTPDEAKKELEAVEKTVISEEERRKIRKKRRKRKVLRLAKRRERERQRQLAVSQQAHATHLSLKVPAGARKKASLGKGQGRKKGPRAVEYICAQCNDPYNSTCDYNPWWALAQQECPKCRKIQIPRIDITAPANSIEYHPALLAHAEDNGGGAGGATNGGVQYLPKPAPPMPPVHLTKPTASAFKDLSIVGSDSDSDLSELSDGSLSDCSLASIESDFDLQALTPAEQAEHEAFGHEYKGPNLSENHTARLLVLMQHASTCPCRHKSARHRDVCRSTKYMMLHVRDCPGTTSTFDVCPFPWCRKVKHMLYHLVSCQDASKCAICSPKDLSKSLHALVGLNKFRANRYRDRLSTAAKKAAAARQATLPSSHKVKKVASQAMYQRPKSGAAPSFPSQSSAAYLKMPPRSAQPTIRKQTKTNLFSTPRIPTATMKKPTPSNPVRHPWSVMQQTNGPPSALENAAYQDPPAPSPHSPPPAEVHRGIEQTPVAPSPLAIGRERTKEDLLCKPARESVGNAAVTNPSATSNIVDSQMAVASGRNPSPIAARSTPKAAPPLKSVHRSPATQSMPQGTIGRTQQSARGPQAKPLRPAEVVVTPGATMISKQSIKSSRSPKASEAVQQKASTQSAQKSLAPYETGTTATPQVVASAADQKHLLAVPLAKTCSHKKSALTPVPTVVEEAAPSLAPPTATHNASVAPLAPILPISATNHSPSAEVQQPAVPVPAAPVNLQAPPVAASLKLAAAKSPAAVVGAPQVVTASNSMQSKTTASHIPQSLQKQSSVQPSVPVRAQKSAVPSISAPPIVPAALKVQQPPPGHRHQTAEARPHVEAPTPSARVKTENALPGAAKVSRAPMAAAPNVKVESGQAVLPAPEHEPVRHQVECGKVEKPADAVEVGG